MIGLTLSLLLAATPPAAGGGFLSEGIEARSASLLGDLELAASWKPSLSAPLRITDDIRLINAETPLPLDEGGGLSSDARQILALVLGFIPGFGLGHLVAKDRDGFILFLIVDVAIYVVGGVVGWAVRWSPFWGIGGLIWLAVHIIQALDAYAEAGGERIVGVLRERAVELAGTSNLREAPVVTTRVFAFDF